MKRIHNMYFISQFFSACVCMCIQRIRLPMQETWVQSSPGKILGEGDGSPFQYSCLEKSHGQRSLAGYSPWGHRVRHDRSTNTTIKNYGEHWCSLLVSNLTQASYFSAHHTPSTHTYTGTHKSNTIFLNYSKITGPSFLNSSTAHIVTPLTLNLGFIFV